MFKTLPEVFKATADKFPDKAAFLTKQGKSDFQGPTWKELYEMGLDLATGLIELGVKPRDHIGLLADNRVEWILVDYAVLISGAADVPRGTDITNDEIEYILKHSDATMTFVEDEKMLGKLLEVRDKLPNIQQIIVMDKAFEERDGILSLYKVMEKGKTARQNGNDQALKNMEQISENDLFTLIYTSGTTGAPKGVQLRHSNMVSQVNNLKHTLAIRPEDRGLSILPVWHVFERVIEYLFIAAGASTYYTNVRTLGDDMKLVKPTLMGSAPRLWESIYSKINDSVSKGSAVKQTLFKWAIYSSARMNNCKRFFSGNLLKVTKPNPIAQLIKAPFYLLGILLWLVPYFLLDTIVLKKLRGATGGQLRATVSGGGALPIHIDAFYNNIGIRVLEGYGMTETSPVISVRTENRLVPGTVGPIIPNTTVEIRDYEGNVVPQGQPGVIFVKGPQVMKGYYKNEEATNKVLNDGWMNTGDLGMLTFNDCLKITGRAKDTVVLFSGENVEPVPIENKIIESQFIEQCMVVGQDKKFLGALIYLNEEAITAWAKEKNLSGKSFEELQKDETVNKMLGKEIKSLVGAQTGFKSFERVVDFRVIPKPFEVGDELTNLFKMKRHVITDKYKDLIDEIYG